MDIRVLKYFLAVATYQSFSKAAKKLNVSQPALSKQIRELEEEYNVVLFDRTTRNVTLTGDGLLLKQQAEEILDLVNKTENMMLQQNKEILMGEIDLGCSESECNRIVMRAIYNVQKDYPGIHFHIYSGNAQYVMEKMNQGIFDLGVVVDPVDMKKYNHLTLPQVDIRGLLLRKDHPLADHKVIHPEDLKDIPLIVSAQEMVQDQMSRWVGDSINISATYNLLFNAKMMAEEGIGSVITLKDIYQETKDGLLTFIPLEPQVLIQSHLIWEKNRIYNQAVEIFIQYLRKEIESNA